MSCLPKNRDAGPRRPPAYAMRALGRSDLPPTFQIGGTTWRHVRTVKHDFFAATGFYEDAAGSGQRVVLKLSRTVDFAGVPLEWLGRWLCRREQRFYARFADLPNVPAVVGTVGRTGFVHAYVEGVPLSEARPVPDGFFDDLFDLLDEVHRRGVAYVDTNKPQNILVGADGRPHLIDFQISWDLHRLRWSRIHRWWLRLLQAEDLYHARKHRRRYRPDELPLAEARLPARMSLWIRLHRLAATPFKRTRRRTLERMRLSGRLLPEGSK